jgi:hypothetical protein
MQLAITFSGVHLVTSNKETLGAPLQFLMSLAWHDITSMGSKGSGGADSAMITMDVFWEDDHVAPVAKGQAMEILEPQFKFALMTPGVAPKAITALWKDYAEWVAEQPSAMPPPPPK